MPRKWGLPLGNQAGLDGTATDIRRCTGLSSAAAMADKTIVRNLACATALALLFGLPASAQQFPPVPAPAPGRSSQPAKPLADSALLAALRKGGYVLYFRHTTTDMSRDDVRSRGDDDCENQRPLTDRGRDEARRIGAAIRELGIPLARVLTSPTCRTSETAMLAFGRAEKTVAVRGGDSTDGKRYEPVRALLSAPLQAGGNLVIVSHGNPFYAVAGAPYLAEGEAAIVRPLGKDFEVVARVRHDGWRALAKN
jgi:phosphohistidine phosphatase SixA